ncbi:MAG: A24 family peptidase [Acidimicrobiales bacterium]|nr:A24 family peptidase [Acidimicrobiales bacterium]
MNLTKLVVCALLALPAGWFAGVLADRIPDDEPLFQDLPPLRAHGRYLALHLSMLVLFVGASVRFQDESWLVLLSYLFAFGSLATLSAIDFAVLRLPDRIVVPTLVISVPLITVASILDQDAAAIRYAIGGGAGYFGFLFIFHLIFGNRGMGFGDVKMASVLGLYLGWLADSSTEVMRYILWAMIVGFLLGTVVGLALFAVYRKSKPYPFGPFLVLGTVVMVFFGQALVTGS